MAHEHEAVYCTLLMSDSYLPGAMVLAHSLRDHGTKAKLVVLVTQDSLNPSTIDELKTIYDEVTPINRITNVSPANLYLMDRPDLISTFSKIELWRQTRYKQIVYIDADVVALRAPDELLTLDTQFAAVPDIGWPDCFNTGVMVLRPNLQDYYSLQALAQRGISFDGADQGLLNMHFGNWKRLSFTYNCTPSGNYQYVPAFRHFQSTISLVHYIGQQKPWNLPRQATPVESPYGQLLGRWWATYDRHFRPEVAMTIAQQLPGKSQERQPHNIAKGVEHPRIGQGLETGTSWTSDTIVQEHGAGGIYAANVPLIVKGGMMSGHVEEQQRMEHPRSSDIHYSSTSTLAATSTPVAALPTQGALSEPTSHRPSDSPRSSGEAALAGPASTHFPHISFPQRAGSPPQEHAARTIHQSMMSAVPRYVLGEEHVSIYRQPHPDSYSSVAGAEAGSLNPNSISSTPALQPQLIENIKTTENKQIPVIDHIPSVVGAKVERPNSPPRFQWDASRAPPPVDSKPEGMGLPSHTYVMSQDTQLFQPPKKYPEAPKNMYYEVPAQPEAQSKPARLFPWEGKAPPPTRVFTEDTPEQHETFGELDPIAVADARDHSEDTVSNAPVSSQRLWQSYVRTNAWDEMPEIERYMRSIQKPRKGSVQVISGSPPKGRRQSTRVTDFPSSAERPSLPVTPAPVSRRYGWTDADTKEERTGELPAAEGVPDQADWKPLERLENLRRRSSVFLESPALSPSREVPKRDMPKSASFGNRSTPP